MSKKIIIPIALSTSILATLLPVSSVNAAADDVAPKTQKSLTNNINLKVNSAADVKRTLQSLPKEKYAIAKHADTYEIKETKTDNLGYTHYTLVPKVGKAVIENQQVKVHVNAQGKVVMVNGDINQEPIKPVNSTTLTKDEAIAKAFEAAGVASVNVRNFDNSDVVNKVELHIDPSTKKYVYDINLLYSVPEIANWHIQIDAQTGNVVGKQNRLRTAITNYQSRGLGYNGTYRPIGVAYDGHEYGLADYSGPVQFEAHTAMNTTTQTTMIVDTDRIFRKQDQKAGVDANYYAKKVYEYYKNVHGRNSYDDKGSKIVSIVHYDVDYNNAAWATKFMIYGDGDGVKFAPLSGALDIIGHELTHAVTENSAQLEYHKQPGAIDEHISDAFAFFMDPTDWDIAEDVYTPGKANDGGLRSLKDPDQGGTLDMRPEHMDDYWDLPDTEDMDWGGVHINAHILNVALYNLIDIQKMDVKKAEKIYYRAQQNYLTPLSQFPDAKAALKRAALDLYSQTEATQIDNAWRSVGL